MVSLNFGAGEYSYKNPIPTPKDLNNSSKGYLKFFQSIKNWFDSESKLDRKNFRADKAQTTNSETPSSATTINVRSNGEGIIQVSSRLDLSGYE
ncbi:MAG: hypothetical protein ACKPKO_49730, partial [Candidatus Fonsibacter sp.]